MFFRMENVSFYLNSIKKMTSFHEIISPDLTVKSLKIKEAVRVWDENLFDPDGNQGRYFHPWLSSLHLALSCHYVLSRKNEHIAKLI